MPNNKKNNLETKQMSETTGKSWYSTGYENVRKEAEKAEISVGPNRIWMPAGGKKQLVFLDDSPTCLHEHNPKIDGDWKNWITCLSSTHDDVACCELLNAKGHKPYYIGFFTVVDCSLFEKDGKKYQYELKLFPAKLKTLKRLQKRKEDKGSFVGKLFDVGRIDEKSPASGDEFEVVRDADLAKLFTLANYKGKLLQDLYAKTDEEGINKVKNTWSVETDPATGKVIPKLTPFNYFKLLHPKTPSEIRMQLKGAHIEQSERTAFGSPTTTAASSAPSSDDIPF